MLFHRQPLGIEERISARKAIREAVAQGSLSEEAASLLLGNHDAFHEFEMRIAVGFRADATGAGGGGKLGNIFNWILANWKSIYAIIAAILPLFGGPALPPLPPNLPNLPNIPPKPPAPPSPGPAAPPHEGFATDFSIPPGALTLGAQIVSLLWPFVEKKIDDYVSGHFGGETP
ncbi:MAG: hypothetical protein ACREQ5_07250 [Candidatus Dormibacteria bacterium]